MDKQTVLIIISLVIILIMINILHSDYFKVKNVIISGNRLLTNNYLLNFVNLKPGANIFAVDCGELKNKLSTLPQFKSVMVRRDLPNELVIEVEEREPIGIIPMQSSYCVIDKEGWILRMTDNLSSWQVPLITGVEIKKEEEKIELSTNLKIIIDYLNKLPKEILTDIGEFNLSPQKDLNLFLSKGGKIRLGKEFNTSEKADRFISIYEEVEKKGLEIEYIDLRYNKHIFVKTR